MCSWLALGQADGGSVDKQCGEATSKQSEVPNETSQCIVWAAYVSGVAARPGPHRDIRHILPGASGCPGSKVGGLEGVLTERLLQKRYPAGTPPTLGGK